ncbi:unnamed protein product [Mesocestoides corti]|uniref:R3H-associated N-terminal domain-containing protein n=1 Tax=Mesocestoides corti TaxID=53468 RepID=A0A0R3UJ29_MESCO|nr:unnamed protein product [Mesocestoides corti]
MILRLQSLNHYSDFDGTSESEASEISIVLPYLPRLRGKKLSKAAEGQVRLKRGSRALRRYENEAYLSSLVMITEADAEYEADDYWPDKTNDDTAFKCLFEDEEQVIGYYKLFFFIRAVWDAFIALSERKQIELLGALDNRPVSGDDDDDLNYEDVDMGDEMAAVRPPRNYNNCASGRSRHGNRRRCRRKPAVRLEGIKEDPSEEAMDAFGGIVTVLVIGFFRRIPEVARLMTGIRRSHLPPVQQVLPVFQMSNEQVSRLPSASMGLSVANVNNSDWSFFNGQLILSDMYRHGICLSSLRPLQG